MQGLFISFLIGLLAAVLDVIPMIVKRLDPMFILAAFVHWLILGFIIPAAELVQTGWLNGLVVALCFVLPQLFLVYRLDRQALPVMFVSSLILGSGIGYLSDII